MRDDGERMVRRLAALSEARQRVAVIAEEADRLGMAGLADVLALVVSRASESRSARDHSALVAALDYLESERLSAERRVEMLEVCRERGYQQLLRLLLSPAEHHRDEAEHVPDYGKGRPLTLGERKSLARRPNRKILERVLADPHPAVIRNLLSNAQLTELDVLKLVSRRPNSADVLREIHQSERWGPRYAVKLALARNPYTPPSLATKLLPLLLRQDLEEILGDRGLHPSVLIACRSLLEGERRPGVQGPDGDGPTVH